MFSEEFSSPSSCFLGFKNRETDTLLFGFESFEFEPTVSHNVGSVSRDLLPYI